MGHTPIQRYVQSCSFKVLLLEDQFLQITFFKRHLISWRYCKLFLNQTRRVETVAQKILKDKFCWTMLYSPFWTWLTFLSNSRLHHDAHADTYLDLRLLVRTHIQLILLWKNNFRFHPNLKYTLCYTDVLCLTKAYRFNSYNGWSSMLNWIDVASSIQTEIPTSVW